MLLDTLHGGRWRTGEGRGGRDDRRRTAMTHGVCALLAVSETESRTGRTALQVHADSFYSVKMTIIRLSHPGVTEGDIKNA